MWLSDGDLVAYEQYGAESGMRVRGAARCVPVNEEAKV